MSEKEGVIYILSNPAMPGLVKTGKTTNLDDRMSSLYSTGVPVPFHCVYAKRVNNYSEVEKKLHLGLRSKRENMNREFFRIAEEEVINFLELIEGVEVTPKEDKFENDDDKVAYEKSSKIGQRFNFEMVQIPNGSELQFVRDETYTCKVISKSEVEFEDNKHSLSSAGLAIMNDKLGFNWVSLAGPLNWKFDGETLSERRKRYEEGNY